MRGGAKKKRQRDVRTVSVSREDTVLVEKSERVSAEAAQNVSGEAGECESRS